MWCDALTLFATFAGLIDSCRLLEWHSMLGRALVVGGLLQQDKRAQLEAYLSCQPHHNATYSSTRMLLLLQVRIRNENDLVLAGHAVLDVSITSTSSVGDSTFVVEGKIGEGGEQAYTLLAVWCSD
jgi:hypothetical protein